MTSYYIVIFIISANLWTNAGTVYVEVTLLPNRTCSNDAIRVNIHEPMELTIVNSNWSPRITWLTCRNAKNNKYNWQARITEANTAMITVDKVKYMGTQLQCWIYLDAYEYSYATCIFAVLYNNLDEAMVFINNNLVTATKAQITEKYDAYLTYTYKDGETVDFSCRCRTPGKYQHCQTILYYFDSQDKVNETARTLSTKVGQCMTASLILKLDLSAQRNSLSCRANQYVTVIYFELKIVATTEIDYLPTTTPKVLQHQEAPPNINSPRSHYHPVVTVTSFYSPRGPVDTTTSPADYLPTTTPKVLQHQEAPPNINSPRSHYHPVVTVTSFYSPRGPVDTTTSPAVSSVENSNPELGERKELDERKEQGEREKWSALLVVGCAAIIPILAAGIAFGYIIRLFKEKKRRNIQGNYDNISSPNNSPSSHPVKWKEPSSVITNNRRPKPICKDTNKLAVYAVPKKELNYAEIGRENTNATRPVVESGGEPNYSTVTEMQTPSREDRYCNVFEQATYINAANTTEYVEPAYCCVKTHK